MNISSIVRQIGASTGIWLLGLAVAPATTALAVDYDREIRPILTDHCFVCHGPDSASRKADLRLDRRTDAIAAGAIVPGRPGESLLIERIFSARPDAIMPPPTVHPPLLDQQKRLLRLWVEQGAEYEPHWAFVGPRKAALPAVIDQSWSRNPIDRFVLAALEAHALSPAPEADRATLIRRISLDLTGLPPAPEVVCAVSTDPSPDAYERLVDRLLETHQYAERRSQDWLDLARYADTRGYTDDKPDTYWPYRDWVVAAIARNQPFDQFTIEQLAGDLLPEATVEQRLATGFHRNAPQAKGETYPAEEYRLKGVVDRVNTTGAVWLGLTVGCAECHDHKFDPLSQIDYYRLFALFNSIEHSGVGHAQGGPSMEWEAPDHSLLAVPVMKELAEPRATFVHVRGNFLDRGQQVTPGTPAFLAGHDAPQDDAGPRDRLEFARWLVSGHNPLVARVVVNRLWQSCFGHGIVRTPADFGLRGDAPTHPELLDWLACEYVESGWNTRAIHRLIVTSATYRQSTGRSAESLARDPLHRLLAGMPRVRLPAEQIRDQALAVSELLTPFIGGPGVFPPQPAGYWEERDLPGTWISSSGPDLYRRSLSIYWRRTALHPSLELLDAPSRTTCTIRRSTANLPLPALVTLNDPLFVEAAEALAARILREAPADDAARVAHAFMLCLGRVPTAQEQSRFLDFLTAAQTDNDRRDRQSIWASVATVMLNLDETLVRP